MIEPVGCTAKEHFEQLKSIVFSRLDTANMCSLYESMSDITRIEILTEFHLEIEETIAVYELDGRRGDDDKLWIDSLKAYQNILKQDIDISIRLIAI